MVRNGRGRNGRGSVVTNDLWAITKPRMLLRALRHLHPAHTGDPLTDLAISCFSRQKSWFYLQIKSRNEANELETEWARE